MRGGNCFTKFNTLMIQSNEHFLYCHFRMHRAINQWHTKLRLKVQPGNSGQITILQSRPTANMPGHKPRQKGQYPRKFAVLTDGDNEFQRQTEKQSPKFKGVNLNVMLQLSIFGFEQQVCMANGRKRAVKQNYHCKIQNGRAHGVK